MIEDKSVSGVGVRKAELTEELKPSQEKEKYRG